MTTAWVRWVCRFGAGVAVCAALGGCAENPPAAAPEATVSESTFQDDLAPYGRWVYTDEYGWVWVPAVDEVGVQFQPYVTGGYWVYTDVGWMFVSDYPWGWATFHYGRWYWEVGYGWVWVPGSVWAPAWVDWRFGAGVVGWAPLPPPGRRRAPWVFVAAHNFRRRHVQAFVLAPARTPALIRATTPVHAEARFGGATWYRGPSVARVQAVTPGSITPLRVTPPRPGVIVRTHISGRAVRYQPRYPHVRGRVPMYRRGGPAVRGRGLPRGYPRGPARPGRGGHRR